MGMKVGAPWCTFLHLCTNDVKNVKKIYEYFVELSAASVNNNEKQAGKHRIRMQQISNNQTMKL